MKRIITIILCFALCFVMVGGSILPGFSIIASAAVTNYTEVMDDLQTDGTFDISKYPVISYEEFLKVNKDNDSKNDINFISLIQIAEGENGELYLYAYQPLNDVYDIKASNVRISISEASTDYKKYSLKCVSYDGVFKKYLVEGLILPNNTYRYYNILEIERPFNPLIDEALDNTITNYVADPVGQTWCCYYEDGKLVYEMQTLQFVEITPTLTDFLYYENGVTWGSLVGKESGCSAHYIAFNIDNFLNVEKIIDASLDYKYRNYRTVSRTESGWIPLIQSWFGQNSDTLTTVYPNGVNFIPEENLMLQNTDSVERKGTGLFSKTYTWNRIMTAEAFIRQFENQGGSFSESAESTLKASQYVFAFCETDIAYQSYIETPDNPMFGTTVYTTVVDGTEVAEVDIFRLHFVSDGKTYNLGVVGDTTSEDNVPGGVAEGLDFNMEDWWQKVMIVLGIIVVILLLNFLSGPLKFVFDLILSGLKLILKFLLWIIKLPFDIIGGLMRRR